MSENKKIRSKKAEEGPQNANKSVANGESIHADSAPPRRNTRGKRVSKGKQGSSNASKSSPENEESQALKLESDPKIQISALKELFPEWTVDDLVFALEEAGHDLELTIAHITEGHASQWGQVTKKQPTKQTKQKSKTGDADATVPKIASRKPKKAPRQDQPQPSRKEKAVPQTKTSTASSIPESSKVQSAPNTDNASTFTPSSKPDDITQQPIDSSNAKTTHATQTEQPSTSTSAAKTTPPQIDKPAVVAPPTQSSKAPWAAIAKVKRKQALPKAAQPTQPTKLPSTSSDAAAVEQPLQPPVPLASRPTEPEVAPQQNEQKVEQEEQKIPPVAVADSGVSKPAVESKPANVTNTAPATTSQSKPVETKAPSTGFHGSTNGITTARLLSDKFPVVMPVANTGAIPEKVQVRFGSLTLGGDESLSNKPVTPPAGFAPKQVKESSRETYASPKPQPPQYDDSKAALGNNTEALPAKRQSQPSAPVSGAVPEYPTAAVSDNSYYFDVKNNPSANAAIGGGAPQVSLPTGNTPTVNKQGNGGFMAMYSPVMHDIAPQQYGVGSSLPMSAASAYSNDPAMAGVHDKANLPYTSRFGKPLENKVETNVSPFDTYQHAEYGAAPGFGPTAAHQHQQNAHAAYSGMSPLTYGQSVPNYFNERSQYSQYDPAVNGTPEMHGMAQNKVGSTAAAIPSLPNTTATASPVVSQQPQPYAFPPMYPVPYMSYGYGSLPYGNNKYGQPQQGYVMQNGLNDFPPILGGHSSIYNRQQSGGGVGNIGGGAQVGGNTAGNVPVDKGREVTGSSLGGFSSMSGGSRSAAAPGMFVNEGEWGAPSPYGYVPQGGLNASPGGHQGTYPSNGNKGGNVSSQGSGFPFNPTGTTTTTTSGAGGSGNGIGSYGAYNQTFMNRPGNWYGNA
ncbi:rnapii degradation factor [Schizosaccharomyces octosporus yFS286]|uniref:RNA polymerase II degradation factor 1 n=1 Tax=Schizosaccharomyces octosporus (strain yFS286) TaxID=483514 RepID=S9Q1Q7_SCHOY|nr:rnapii degradation factor [Schizosaccharomyces octosporus yFS286]EPX75231.1 rnapii degradation factor [Schizosaccharomyces octosporus yFS286]